MFWIIKLVRKTVKVLGSNVAPQDIARGIALGWLLGLVPLNIVYTPLVLVLWFMVRSNFGSVLLTWGIVAMFAGGLGGLFDSIGGYLLIDATGLKLFWTFLYNLPIVPWTNFNNTVAMGSFVFALLSVVPMYWLSVRGVIGYRQYALPVLSRFKVVQMMKGTKVVSWVGKILKD